MPNRIFLLDFVPVHKSSTRAITRIPILYQSDHGFYKAAMAIVFIGELSIESIRICTDPV